MVYNDQTENILKHRHTRKRKRVREGHTKENEEGTRHDCICHDGGKLKRHRSAAFRNEECKRQLRFHFVLDEKHIL